MSVFCYDHDGAVASCDQIKQSHACDLSGGKSEPGHYYFYHYAPQCGSHPGRRAGDAPPTSRSATSGRSPPGPPRTWAISPWTATARWPGIGHRYVLNLRPYESYTRYWGPLDNPAHASDRPKEPDYFRPMADGSDPDDQHGLHNIRGNGRWLFQPDLAAEGLPGSL